MVPERRYGWGNKRGGDIVGALGEKNEEYQAGPHSPWQGLKTLVLRKLWRI